MIQISFWSILFTVVNLLILFIAFRIFFFKPLAKIIAQRQKEADELYEEALSRQNDAEELKNSYEQKLIGTESERKQILAEARKHADGEYQNILADAKSEASQIHKDAVAAAEHEKSEIIGSARKEIAQLIVDATTKVVGSKNSAEVDSDLYEQFLGKAGE